MINEELKAELFQASQKGLNASKLLETQLEIIAEMKMSIARQLAEVKVGKSTATKKILGFSFNEESRVGLEELEAYQAELRVITNYEDLLKALVSNGEMAKANLKTLNERN